MFRSMVGAFLKKFASCFPRSLGQLRLCRACRRAAAREDRGRVAAVFACSVDTFACEQCCATWYSPGRVEDHEVLHFLVTDPQTIDTRSGKLLPRAVNQVHERGLSVLRDCASNEEFEITFAMLRRASDSKGQQRYWHSVSIIPAMAVRYNGDGRAFAVLDTGYRDRPAHADIMAPGGTRREREKQIKALLGTLDANLIGVANFRMGVFTRHAQP